ncbi:hypothetical protein M408DRAFT_25190 [Serendipita vermifera MAFF 305830]|uniref:BRCT domain-containing protein n=1 Tax=Serendipita vermifera MAFF 305830 TaxID=933852 RepID=A0A0C3B3F9_SERVB|nr:hypothetical protein M408DRAFT_25190 [Serendipita vermifera MAFF 305830]
MEPTKKLFLHEDGEPFSFTIHPQLNNADQVERLIMLQGGSLIDWNHISKADFMIIPPFRGDAWQLTTSAKRFGVIAVDQSWLFHSAFAEKILPLYTFQPGVGEDKDVETRDIRALVSCIANSKNIYGPAFPFIHMARKYPHRTSRQFQELYEQNKQAIDESVAKITGKRLDTGTRYPNSVESTPSMVSTIPLAEPSFRGPSQWLSLLPAPSIASLPRGADQESNQGGGSGVSQFSPNQRAPSEQAGSVVTAANSLWFDRQITPVGRLGSMSNPRESRDIEMPASMDDAPIHEDVGTQVAARQDVGNSSQEPRLLASPPSAQTSKPLSSANTGNNGGENDTNIVKPEEEFDHTDFFVYEYDAMRVWRGNHPLRRTTSLVNYWSEFTRETSVGKGRTVEEWVKLDEHHRITKPTMAFVEPHPTHHPAERAITEETSQPGTRRRLPRTNKGGIWVWTTSKDGKDRFEWIAKSHVPNE